METHTRTRRGFRWGSYFSFLLIIVTFSSCPA